MNKHLDILKQLWIWYWNKDSYESNKWITLSSSTQDYYIKCYVYDNLK